MHLIFINQRKLSHNKHSPLHIAAYRNSREIFEILIAKGANINDIDIIYLNIDIFF